MIRLALALAVSFLALTGCRDYIVDPLPPGEATPFAPPEGAAEVQLKGPAHLVVGSEFEFKAQLADAGTVYEWRVSGPLSFFERDDTSRYLRGVAQGAGEVTVRVLLRDADDVVIGAAERTVVVRTTE